MTVIRKFLRIHSCGVIQKNELFAKEFYKVSLNYSILKSRFKKLFIAVLPTATILTLIASDRCKNPCHFMHLHELSVVVFLTPFASLP